MPASASLSAPLALGEGDVEGEWRARVGSAHSCLSTLQKDHDPVGSGWSFVTILRGRTAPPTVRPLVRDPRVLIGWPLPTDDDKSASRDTAGFTRAKPSLLRVTPLAFHVSLS